MEGSKAIWTPLQLFRDTGRGTEAQGTGSKTGTMGRYCHAYSRRSGGEDIPGEVGKDQGDDSTTPCVGGGERKTVAEGGVGKYSRVFDLCLKDVCAYEATFEGAAYNYRFIKNGA